MSSITSFIQKLWTGKLTRKESAELDELLRDSDGRLRKELSDSFNKTSAGRQDAEEYYGEASEMYSRLLARIDMASENRSKPVFSIRSSMSRAAIIIAVALTGVLIYQYSTRKVQSNVVTAAVTDTSLFKSVTNSASDKMTISLKDGSVVTLFSNSTISYKENFDKNIRNIELKGKAYFKVAKDAHKPFIVQSGGFTTTALGTQFSVDTRRSGRVEVKLYEGKVVIRSVAKGFHLKNDVYLTPLQSFTGDTSSGQFTVNEFTPGKYLKAGKTNRSGERESPKTQLDFDHEQLSSVFDKLNENFHANIKYSGKQLKGLYFTGTVFQTDSLQTIITIISKMNGLTFEEKGDCILVHQTN